MPLNLLNLLDEAVCVQHMCMFKLMSRFSRQKTCHDSIRDFHFTVFNSQFQRFTVFKAIIQKDFLKVRVCVIAFRDIVINSAVFQVQTVSVSSYGECSGAKAIL